MFYNEAQAPVAQDTVWGWRHLEKFLLLLLLLLTPATGYTISTFGAFSSATPTTAWISMTLTLPMTTTITTTSTATTQLLKQHMVLCCT